MNNATLDFSHSYSKKISLVYLPNPFNNLFSLCLMLDLFIFLKVSLIDLFPHEFFLRFISFRLIFVFVIINLIGLGFYISFYEYHNQALNCHFRLSLELYRIFVLDSLSKVLRSLISTSLTFFSEIDCLNSMNYLSLILNLRSLNVVFDVF